MAIRIFRHYRLARRTLRLIGFLIASMATASPAFANQAATATQAFADIHVHYKWNQAEITSVDEAIAALKENHIGMAVVTGTPPELALQLADAAPEIVVPIYGIYRNSGDWSVWPFEKDLLQRVRTALETGRYRGIGEVHLIGGFVPKRTTENVSGLFRLAGEFDVPVLLHTEFSTADYLISTCRQFTETRFLWAHAGTTVPTAEVDRALQSCPNVWVELSARDPWRYVNHPIADADHHLLPEWRELVLRWQDRFMVGSDPVWPVEQLDAWDTADSGWDEIGRFVDFHRQWIAKLPREAADKIRWSNARAFFGQDSVLAK